MDDEELPQGRCWSGSSGAGPGAVTPLWNFLEWQMGWHERHGQGDGRSIRAKSGALICRGDGRLGGKVGQRVEGELALKEA